MGIYGYVYKITNKINGKIYIGQTTSTFDKRYNGNIANTHNKHLRSAIEKYGIDNFIVDKEFRVATSKEELNKLEKECIEMYKSNTSEFGYNKTSGGESYEFSEEIKRKISENRKGIPVTEETRLLLSSKRKGELNGMYGKKHTESTIQKIKEARAKQVNPMLGKNHNEASKRKMAEKKSKKVRCHTGEVFDSALEASKWCGLKCSTSLCKSCKDKTKTAGKHPLTNEKLRWEYIDN